MLIILLLFAANTFSQDLASEYLQEWKQFYPSKAVVSGMRSSIFSYEDRSQQAIQRWVDFNKEVMVSINENDPDVQIDAIDGRLLRVQAQSEIDRWQKLRVQENDLGLYLKLLGNAFSSIYDTDYLTVPEKGNLICDRLTSMLQLVNAARLNLQRVTQKDLEKSKENFSIMLATLDALPVELTNKGIPIRCKGFEEKLQSTKIAIEDLAEHVSQTLSEFVLDRNDILGKEEYARQLVLYTDSDLTPEELQEMAMREIQLVRKLMDEVASTYLQRTYQRTPLPNSFEGRLEKAIGDMENDVPLNGTDYESFWRELSEKAIAFVREKGLGTLPENQTLSIQSAPESAGPAARIGWVGSAPPFDPNPWTTLYLPSVPDTLPEQEQIDFWSSFNKPFNRIIVIHELFPGHYMQLKISRETPHPVRLLFPYGVYIEGWATFCERVALDQGWDAGNEMTLLAHLRKRIENANRAYTSVMVHTQGWTQEQVLTFSKETSLVAPQFAKSLWYRLMRSPMQLTSYFLGGAQFTQLLKSEMDRLGDQFDLTLFMDTIMKSGPIPIDEFKGIFAETIPN